VCAAPNKVAVPDVLGKSKAEVEKALTAAKLKWTYNPVDSTAKLDEAVGTSPGPGNPVDVNSTVIVNVSKDNQRKMPDVSGKSESEAKSLLAKAGFDVNRVRVQTKATSDDDDVDKVLSQTPSADSTQFKNVNITLVIGQKQNTPNPGPSSPSASSSSGTG
jgi:serine/threonine-protein kinase